jgi:inhibitor of Bruton tyrosine kinase
MNWTPLHRAINYACLDVAVLLKRYGASFDIFDSDYFTPLQMIHQTRHEKLDKIDLQAVVWGRNKNYNLGIGNITTKEIPDILKGLPNIKTASINKFHSLFLSNDSKLYGCGHSKEGRLGVGESTLTQPQPIAVKLNYKHETIIDVAVGMSHSLVLTNKSIYGTGSNKYYQLGMETVESVLGFKEIPFDRTEVDMRIMFKIIACDFHSLFISKAGVYVCGLNVGQFNGIQEVNFNLLENN